MRTRSRPGPVNDPTVEAQVDRNNLVVLGLEILILRHVGNQRAKSLEEITIAERHFGAVVYQENLDVALIGEIYFRNAAGESRRPVVEFLEHSHSGYDPSGVF